MLRLLFFVGFLCEDVSYALEKASLLLLPIALFTLHLLALRLLLYIEHVLLLLRLHKVVGIHLHRHLLWLLLEYTHHLIVKIGLLLLRLQLLPLLGYVFS